MRAYIQDDQTLWATIGDFNAILSASEKTGGLTIGNRYPHFDDFVESIDLFDLGFRGSLFMWHEGNLFERLDRALGNEAWIRNFSNSLITDFFSLNSSQISFYPEEDPFDF